MVRRRRRDYASRDSGKEQERVGLGSVCGGDGRADGRGVGDGGARGSAIGDTEIPGRDFLISTIRRIWMDLGLEGVVHRGGGAGGAGAGR